MENNVTLSLAAFQGMYCLNPSLPFHTITDLSRDAFSFNLQRLLNFLFRCLRTRLVLKQLQVQYWQCMCRWEHGIWFQLTITETQIERFRYTSDSFMGPLFLEKWCYRDSRNWSWWVLTVVYTIQNDYCSLLFTLSIVQYSKNWGTHYFGNCFHPQVSEETPTLTGYFRKT